MDRTSRVRKIVKHNAGLIIFLFGMAFFRTAVADWNHVPSGSMEPTLFDGDWVWVDKTAYGASIPFANINLFKLEDPQRGDIITFVPPHTDQLYVKRVIGIPGDRVRVAGREITVNGQVLPYQATGFSASTERGVELQDATSHLVQYSSGGRLPFFKQTLVVPPDRYFVMGDHRNNSADSRYWGFVDRDKVMGKVTHIAFSIASERSISDRFASRVN